MLTLLHTADAHVPRFDALRDRLAPDLPLTHVVRADWLDRARREGAVGPDLQTEIQTAIDKAQGPVLCTCSTLGPCAEGFGAIRIDRPMMQQAAQTEGRIALVYCLESTADISLTLLAEELSAVGRPLSDIDKLALPDLWPLFESGNTNAFAQAIADRTQAFLADTPAIRCVVLAQASMDGAAPLLSAAGHKALASPEAAFLASLPR